MYKGLDLKFEVETLTNITQNISVGESNQMVYHNIRDYFENSEIFYRKFRNFLHDSKIQKSKNFSNFELNPNNTLFDSARRAEQLPRIMLCFVVVFKAPQDKCTFF